MICPTPVRWIRRSIPSDQSYGESLGAALAAGRHPWQRRLALEELVAQRLSDAGHHVVAIDQRGHGRSDKPHEPTAYAMRLRVAVGSDFFLSLPIK